MKVKTKAIIKKKNTIVRSLCHRSVQWGRRVAAGLRGLHLWHPNGGPPHHTRLQERLSLLPQPQARQLGAKVRATLTLCFMSIARTTVSQDVQTRSSVQLAFAKFLSKIKGIFWGSAVSMILALYWKFPFILNRNLAKANCTEDRVCTFCDTVVLGK